MIKPIETHYKGYRFRSRLEARWAVFFDTLGEKWEYEYEGYSDKNGFAYLPDFVFDNPGGTSYFIEIKAKPPTNHEIKKARTMADNGMPGYILIGTPEAPQFDADGEMTSGSWAMMFGTIANACSCEVPCDPRPWIWMERRTPDAGFILWPYPAHEFLLDEQGKPVVQNYVQPDDMAVFDQDKQEFTGTRCIGLGPDGRSMIFYDPGKRTFAIVELKPQFYDKACDSPTLLAAYTAARSARFEYGECG